MHTAVTTLPQRLRAIAARLQDGAEILTEEELRDLVREAAGELVVESLIQEQRKVVYR